MKIAFFDSGVGGLTIFNKCINKINSEYIYFADNLNTPYGLKDKETIRKIVINNMKKIYEHNPDIVVIACNTATSVAIQDLRKMYGNKCIIGTEPAVKVASDNSIANKKILVCATTLTTNEEKLHKLIKSLNIESITDFLPLDKLVEFAEKLEFDSINVNNYLLEKFNSFDLNEYSHIVLGCTHFPLFKNAIQRITPECVQIIDSSDGVVKNVVNKIKELDLEQEQKSNVTLILTNNDNTFAEKFSNITGLKDFEINII